MAERVYSETDFTGMDPIEAYKTALMVENNQQVSPEQAQANQLGNLYDLASVLPITGSAVSAHETQRSLFDAAKAMSDDEWLAAGGHGLLAGLNALGIVAGTPVGKHVDDAIKGAGSRAAVFLPLPKNSSWERKVKGMRDKGMSSEEIWDRENFLLSPEGTVKLELPDTNMTLKGTGQPGDDARLSDVIEHPELFARRPEFKNIKVNFYDNPADTTRAKTDSAGDFMLNVGHATQAPGKPDIAKLLQYSVNRSDNLPLGKGHGTKKYRRDMDEAAVRAMLSGSPDAGAYITRLNEERGIMDTLARGGANVNDVDRMMGLRNAGNVEAYNVQHRAKPNARLDRYPYTHGQPAKDYDSNKLTIKRSAPFEELLPLPNKNLTDEEMADFLTNWRRYGSGKR